MKKRQRQNRISVSEAVAYTTLAAVAFISIAALALASAEVMAAGGSGGASAVRGYAAQPGARHEVPVRMREDVCLTAADTQARMDRYEANIRDYAPLEPDPDWDEEDEPCLSAEEDPTQAGADRSKPIYEVYKNGRLVNAPAEIQWMVRDLAQEQGFEEKLIIGMMVEESSLKPKTVGGIRCVAHDPGCAYGCYGDDECGCPTRCELDPEACVFQGRWYGLAQLSKYWLSCSKIAQYRLTDDYRRRDLLDPWDNLLTLAEIWSYARDIYELDLDIELGLVRLLYWHNTGQVPTCVTRWAYASRIFGYMDELVLIDYAQPEFNEEELQ